MNQDTIILHLTDLHFSTSDSSPSWVDPFLRCLEGIVRDAGALYGIAVTGDLVDSPDKGVFHAVYRFLTEQALKVGRVFDKNGHVDMSRLWVVDGNHDYRTLGFLPFTNGGILECGNIPRQDTAFCDDERRLLIIGMNSGKRGRLARGTVTLDDLRRFEKEVHLHTTDTPTLATTHRIALLHHHLLPLPYPPRETLDRVQSLSAIVRDEGVTLLNNAGLVVSILVRNNFDLVLHGHQHNEFQARVHYLSDTQTNKFMAVVGGPAARRGFNVVVLSTSGEVRLDRFAFDENIQAFYKCAFYPLWSYDEWRKAAWEQEARHSGYSEQHTLHCTLTTSGDCHQRATEKGIVRGPLDGPLIDVTSYVTEKELAVVAYDSVIDLNCGLPMPERLPDPAHEVHFQSNGGPTYQASRIHAGYEIQRSFINAFALSKRDAAIRALKDERESLTHFLKRPTQYSKLTLQFPAGLQPEYMEIAAHRNSDYDDTDPAETKRANSHFHYEAKHGWAILNLPYVSPSHKYRFSWPIPDHEPGKEWQELERLAAPYMRFLQRSKPDDASSSVNGWLLSLRKRLIDSGLGDSDSVGREDPLEVGMFMLDDSGSIVPIGGTYNISSSVWSFKVRWGLGMRGLSLRRGRPHFYRRAGAKYHLYIQPEDCKHDEYVLSVPLFIPPQKDPHPVNDAPGDFFRVAIAVTSVSKTSGLARIWYDGDNLERSCALIQEAFNEFATRSNIQ